MSALTARNLKVFFRDRTAVVMSFFSVLVVIGLYGLFLGEQMISSFEASGIKNPGEIVNSWVISGIVAVTTMTSSLGALGVMVEDRASGIERDFIVSPLPRAAIAGSYAVSMYCIGAILSLVTFLVGEAYIAATGGKLLSAHGTFLAVGGILLGVASSGSIVLFITSFLSTMSGYSLVSLIIGVSIGFVTGVYIPIGSIPEGVQSIVKLFPVSYTSSYFRQIMSDAPIASAFEGVSAEHVDKLREELGVTYIFGSEKTDITTAVVVMIITVVVFTALTCLVFSRRQRKS